MVTLMTANLVNLAGNWVLVFGNLGAPKLGAEGAGWATCISRVYMMAMLGAVIWRNDRRIVAHVMEAGCGAHPEITRAWLPGGGADGPGNVRVRDGHGSDRTIGRHRARRSSNRAHDHQHDVHDAVGNQLRRGGPGGQAIGRSDPAGAARSGWTALALGGGVMSARRWRCWSCRISLRDCSRRMRRSSRQE